MLKSLRLAAARIWTRASPIRDWLNWEAADNRSLALLQAWLSPAQLSQFRLKRHFDVVGSDTGRRYRIRYGTSTNVYELNARGRIHVGWCFQPVGSLTAGDVMLAQKIALETDENATLAIANKFPGTTPPRAGSLPFG